MIRPLRQLHRRLFLLLALGLPLAFGLGVAARKPLPILPAAAPALAAQLSVFKLLVWERSDLFGQSAIVIRLLGDPARPGH